MTMPAEPYVPADTIRDEINRVIHAGLGVETPCEHGCPHFVVAGMSALGIANVMSRHEG
jgi:hypothetical protein